MDALLHEQYLFDLQAEEEVAGEGEDLDQPLLRELVVAGLREDEQGNGGDEMAEEVDIVDIHVQLGVLFAGVAHEEHHDEEEVDEDEEGMDVLVVVGDPHQQDREVGHTEVDEPPQAADQRAQVQRVLELEVLVAQLDLLEEEEDDAVDEYPHLVMRAGADDGSEEIEVVAHHQPLEHQHVVDVLRTQRGFIYGEGYAIVLGVHQA